MINTNSQVFDFKNNTLLKVVATIGMCSVEDSLNIEVVKDIKIPVVVTPDGNGENEAFEIENREALNIESVEIYNRWGNKVFEADYSFESWDGTFKSNPSPNGTYYYIIKLSGDSEVLSGYFTLMR